MKLRNYFLPAVLAGFSLGVLNSIPFLKPCCLLIPVGGFFAVYLYRAATKIIQLDLGRVALIGVLTGLFAALFATSFDVLFTYITRSNEIVESLPEIEKMMKNNFGKLFESTFQIYKYMSDEIRASGFSLLYTIGMLFSYLIIDTIFAFIGAVFARSYFNKRAERQ